MAVITGGARGIGGASALRLAEEGRDIVIADTLEEEAADVVKEIEQIGQRALFIKTDVTDFAAVQSMVGQTVETFGRLDILVCCAGILGLEAPFHQQSVEQFDKVMRINIYGVLPRPSGSYPSHVGARLGTVCDNLLRSTSRRDQCSTVWCF